MLLVEIAFSLPFALVGIALGFAEWNRKEWERMCRMAEEVSLDCIGELDG